MPRIGLVLGAGGSVGHAFHAGVLAGISDATGWDARDAEVIVGTSAGSVVGALLRATISPADLAGARHRHATVGGRPEIVVPRGRDSGELAADPDATAARAALRRCRHRARSCAGRCSRGLCASARSWPRPCPRVACRPSSSRRACVRCSTAGPSSRCGSTQSPSRPAGASRSGATRASRRDVATAVAASCAIPAFFAPVSIDGVRYVDGGVHSPTNADLVAGLGLDLVVISSPMSIARGGVRIAPDQPARRLARFALGARGRAGPSRRNSGAHVPADRFRPRRDGPERDGRLAFVGCHECGSRVGASTARRAGRREPERRSS